MEQTFYALIHRLRDGLDPLPLINQVRGLPPLGFDSFEKLKKE